MKIALFNDYVLGIVEGDAVVDVSGSLKEIMDLLPAQRMLQVIEDWDRVEPRIHEAMARGPRLALDEVSLRAPIPRPGKILCALGNYREGVAGSSTTLNLFLKAPTSVIGPGERVVLPEIQAAAFHHEAELAVVIGRRGRHIAEDAALDHVFGYTCFNDVSARDVPELGRGVGYIHKSWDTFGPMGPWIVTRDEIADPQNVNVRLWVDDELRQDYNTQDMDHPVSELIAWASRVATLDPGDLISCGTNHQGLGPVQDGDRVAMEVDGVGRLEVTVEDPFGRSWPKGVDRDIAQRVRSLRSGDQ